MLRTLRLALVTTVIAGGLVLVPLPGFAWADELETVTTAAVLERVESVVAHGVLEHSPVGHAYDIADDLVGAVTDVAVADHVDHGAGHGPDVSDHPVSAQALQAAAVGVDAFNTVGVTLSDEPEGAVAFRVREPGGWSPWRELSFSEDHAPEDEEAAGALPGVTSNPFYIGAADGYEIQVPPNVAGVDVHLVKPTTRQVRVEVKRDTAGAAPAIHSRAEWGARAPSSRPVDAGELSMAVVHHTAGSATGPTPAILRAIQAYHMDANGWSDIGYNFVVDTAGRVWEARAGGIDRAIVGAHAAGFNTGSTGVAILGHYDYAAPTNESVHAVENLLAWKLALHHVPTTGNHVYRSGTDTRFGPAGTAVSLPRVLGHRDVGWTSCPGGHLYARTDQIRAGASSRTPTHQHTVPAKVLAGDWTGNGLDDLLLYRPGHAEERLYYSERSNPTAPDSPGLVQGAVQELVGGGQNSADHEPVTHRKGSATVGGLYQPLVGDFNGDGIDDVLWYGEGPAPDRLWLGRPDGRRDSFPITVDGWYEPFVGDFNGDGRDDVFWYAPGSESSVWYGQADGSFALMVTWAPGFAPRPLVGDFNGDGRDDIFWYGAGSAPDAVWYGHSPGGFVPRAITVNGRYRPVVGDFDGDGRDDIFWYGPGDHHDSMWTGQAGYGVFGHQAYSIGGDFDPVVGDFDGNGSDDILWKARGGGSDRLWAFATNGRYTPHDVRIPARFKTGGMTLAGAYLLTVAGIDGDGHDQIFSQESPTTGRLWSWDRQHRQFTSTRIG